MDMCMFLYQHYKCHHFDTVDTAVLHADTFKLTHKIIVSVYTVHGARRVNSQTF